MLATGTAVYAQLRERLEEEEAERARVGIELNACKGQLQALKDRSLEWCGSYMESAAKMHNMQEQYRLDRAEWRSDLKDMQDQRDRYQAIVGSQRCDRVAEDRRWHEIEAKVILDSLTETSGEKRKLSAKEVCEEARKRWKGKGKESKSGHVTMQPSWYAESYDWICVA